MNTYIDATMWSDADKDYVSRPLRLYSMVENANKALTEQDTVYCIWLHTGRKICTLRTLNLGEANYNADVIGYVILPKQHIPVSESGKPYDVIALKFPFPCYVETTCTLNLSNLDCRHGHMGIRLGVSGTMASDTAFKLFQIMDKATKDSVVCSPGDIVQIENAIWEYRKYKGWPHTPIHEID